MPIPPTVPPVGAVPTPAAALAHQFDRRSGAEFGRARLGWGERGGLCRDGRKGQYVSLHRVRWPECARQSLMQPERAHELGMLVHRRVALRYPARCFGAGSVGVLTIE